MWICETSSVWNFSTCNLVYLSIQCAKREQIEWWWNCLFRMNELRTNDRLNVFRFIVDIEQSPSSKSVSQRIVQWTQMIVNFRWDQSCQFSMFECLVFIKWFTKLCENFIRSDRTLVLCAVKLFTLLKLSHWFLAKKHQRQHSNDSTRKKRLFLYFRPTTIESHLQIKINHHFKFEKYWKENR